MGLFDRFKSKKLHQQVFKELYKKDEGFRKQHADLKKQEAMNAAFWKANEKYKQDGNLQAYIRVLEQLFVESDPPPRNSHVTDLADLYMKAGDNNKAWAYTNWLLSNGYAKSIHVREIQARIQKKEKRWGEAVMSYALFHLARAESMPYREDLFLKDIKSSANKLGWSDVETFALSRILKEQIKRKNFSERELAVKVVEFLNEHT